MQPATKVMGMFEVAALCGQMAQLSDRIAAIVEQPGFDKTTQLLVDELLGGRPGPFAVACRMAVGEIRGPADRLAKGLEISASLVAQAEQPTRFRSPEFLGVISTPIPDVEGGKAFLRVLIAHGLEFHLEDDPAEIETREGESYVRCFTDAEADLLRLRVRELYSFKDWGPHDCPIGYVLDQTTPKWREG